MRLAAGPLIAISALVGGVVAPVAPAIAQTALSPVVDCPLRDAPFSTDLPLIDLMLNAEARAAVEDMLGDEIDALPGLFLQTEAPSFGAIIRLDFVAERAGKTNADVAAVDAAIREIPVTDADRAARCARYDNDVPALTLEGDAPRLLLFEKVTGYLDAPAFNAAHATFVELADEQGWQIAVSDRGGAISPEVLDQIDVIIWNNISGDVLTLSQREALRDFVENGGGFVAVHGGAGDPVYFWDWFPDTLIGAQFWGTPSDPRFQEARVVLDDPSHPAVTGIPSEWRMTDEWYAFRTNPRDSGSRVVLTLDESTYDPSAGVDHDQSMGDDHPIAWSRIVGKGRMFYSAIGHLPETYSHEHYRSILRQALAWAAGEGCDCE